MISRDTIVAPATPFGYAGLAVIRISGPETLDVLLGLTGEDRPPEPRVASLRSLLDPSQESVRFEQAIITFFKDPHSYTGEDSAEISVHGNPLIVQKTIDIICSFGVRLAEPGEFTQRAFLNSKMDLIQAESVAALIHSRSEAAARLNYRLVRGDLSDRFVKIKSSLMKFIGRIEWWLDISEEETDPDLKEFLDQTLSDLFNQLDSLIESYNIGKRINEGFKVVIAGEPNVGKSTLLNSLTGTDRAITSNIPGTTRDTIDYSFEIEGIPITLIDTAGLRETQDTVENIGIERARKSLQNADLILQVRDNSTNYPRIENLTQTPVIKVFNKKDLLNKTFIDKNSEQADLYISAINNKGIDGLKTNIKNKLGIIETGGDVLSLTTARQHRALVNCKSALEKTARLINQNPPDLELVSVELLDALGAIDTVLGKTTPDDILNGIFGYFCVGK